MPLGEAFNAGSAVSVGGTTTTVASANPNRSLLILTNDHATQVVYLKFSAAAAALNSGARLNAAGGSLVISDYEGAVQAIATGASTPVLVAEF